MITWLGHATIRIKTEDLLLYFDPYKIQQRERADLVLVSHEHFDHCSLEDLKQVSTKKTHFVGSPKTEGALRRIANRRYTIVEAGQQIEAAGVLIRAVPAYNIDKPFHPKEMKGVGYIVEVDDKKVYFAGDTDLIPEMKDIACDIAILPVGGTYTMNADEAAKAFQLVGATEGIPMHYGTVIGAQSDADRFKRLIS